MKEIKSSSLNFLVKTEMTEKLLLRTDNKKTFTRNNKIKARCITNTQDANFGEEILS